MPTLETYHGGYLWKYVPNFPAAISFAVIFSILSIAHTWKMLRYRTWYCIPFVIGGFCEPLGYACRALATYNTGALVPFLLQAIFLLLAPCLFAGTLYMVYSRIVRAVYGERFSLISPKWCTWIFVSGDLLCLNIQSTGAGFLPKENMERTGNAVIVTGLGLQVLIFAGFMWCCILFHRNFKRHLSLRDATIEVRWEQVLYMLYGTSVVISIRNIFRLVEYIAGKDSYFFLNEWPIYVFDGVLMLATMVGFYVWYPPQLPNRNTESMIELTSEDGAATDPSNSTQRKD